MQFPLPGAFFIKLVIESPPLALTVGSKEIIGEEIGVFLRLLKNLDLARCEYGFCSHKQMVAGEVRGLPHRLVSHIHIHLHRHSGTYTPVPDIPTLLRYGSGGAYYL